MAIDPVQASPSISGASTDEKGRVMHVEDVTEIQDIKDLNKMSKTDRIHAIDAIAENPNVTHETFAHLDIKKILRKMDIHLIPMLTALVRA